MPRTRGHTLNNALVSAERSHGLHAPFVSLEHTRKLLLMVCLVHAHTWLHVLVNSLAPHISCPVRTSCSVLSVVVLENTTDHMNILAPRQYLCRGPTVIADFDLL
jgi:hypothetical protein